MSASSYWVVDVEGSGTHPPEIVELALQEVTGFRLADRLLHWRVRPEGPITPFATKIHGIRAADLSRSPSMEDISDDVLVWLEGAAIVGHNVRVDLDALSRGLGGWRPAMAIDTLRLAKALRPGQPSYGLERLAASFGLDGEAARRSGLSNHSAPYDAMLAALLFVELVADLATDRRQAVIAEADILKTTRGDLL